ncbi:MAG: ester cyclase [Solirubrobacteraceae bacterium]
MPDDGREHHGYAQGSRERRELRRFLDQVVNGGQLELIDDLWAENLVWHGGSLGEIHGIDAYKQMMSSRGHGAFSAMHLTVHDVVAAQDKVVARFTNSGTQVGQFLGFPPTGNRARWLGIGIYTIHAGKIAEAWFSEDILSMLLQLGAISLPPSDREDVPS